MRPWNTWLLTLTACAPVRVVGPEETATQETDTRTEDTAPSDSRPPDSAETGETADSAASTPLPTLCINEILAANAFTTVDEAEGRSDWIELYNPSDEDLSLDGLTITDNLSEPDKYALPGYLVVPARGYLLLYAAGVAEYGTAAVPFKLSADGEELGLFLSTGESVDQVRFGAQFTDWSVARAADCDLSWVAGVEPTPLASNGSAATAPDAPGGEVEQAPAAEDPSEAFYVHERVVEAGIVLSDESYAALLSDPYTWVEGAFVYEGRSYAPIAVRVKGENSFLPISQKSSLKLKFDAYVDGGEFLGMQEITFNNMSNDYSMMHEHVAYWMYRQAGVPAARANHAWLTLNGEPYGLFANVETVDRTLIGRWFADPEGTLYEVHDVDFYDGYIEDFTLEYGEDDRTNLQGTADAMERSGASAFTELADHMDLDSFLAYWAVSAVIGQFDSYPYGYPGDDTHVYDDPSTGVLHWLPHGVDETFYYPSNGIFSTNGVLAVQCEDYRACEAQMIAAVWEVQTLAEDLDLLGFAEDVRRLIMDYVTGDPNVPYALEYVDYYQEVMLSFIEDRAGELESQIGDRP